MISDTLETPVRTRDSLRRALTRRLPAAARIALGLVFLVFGLDGFLHFTPQPDPSSIPAAALAFGMAMMKTGYLFQLVKGTEVVVGVLLLANRFVALGLTLIAPVIVNIVAFHAFLEPSGLPLALSLLGLELYLAFQYRSVYRPMLALHATSGAP